MATYKLESFDRRGQGELARYLFVAAGKDFEDIRYKPEQWPAAKPSTPFGQLPILHVDGKKLAQSGAIVRFLSREFGLDGKNNWEKGLVDQSMELAVDMSNEVFKCYYETDIEKKKELTKNLNEVVYPKYCGLFEKALEQNGGEYFVGTSLTTADLAVIDVFDTPLHHTPNLLDLFPKLKVHRERIATRPDFANYIERRKADSPLHHNPNLLDSSPKLEAHRERIATRPDFANYIENIKHLEN